MTQDGAITLKVIARIESDFHQKFGIPRQSGLVEQLRARIVFEPEYRNESALTGLEEYSHIWLLWEFSKAVRETWSPTVRPPRLGGNTHMGVFATRSPFRPNPLGLSCVELIRIEKDKTCGPVLIVAGADLLDGTPIYDIKPYLAYADSRPDARCGFVDRIKRQYLTVHFPEHLLRQLPEDKREAAVGILREDPRPSYESDPDRRYGVAFAGYDIGFFVAGSDLTVVDIRPLGQK